MELFGGSNKCYKKWMWPVSKYADKKETYAYLRERMRKYCVK